MHHRHFYFDGTGMAPSWELRAFQGEGAAVESAIVECVEIIRLNDSRGFDFHTEDSFGASEPECVALSRALNGSLEGAGAFAPSRVKIGGEVVGSFCDQNGLQRATVAVVRVLPGADPASGHPVSAGRWSGVPSRFKGAASAQRESQGQHRSQRPRFHDAIQSPPPVG